MTLTGKQKAAMLLISLDAAGAAELLKGFDPKLVRDLAVELSYLDTAGLCNSQQTTDVARQFCESLQKKPEFEFKTFLKELLKSAVGQEKADQIQTQVQDLLKKRDPFITIRSADTQTLSSVLESEHPQAVAVVLSEMTPRKSSEIIGLLGEGVRLSAVGRMTALDSVTPEAKARIAQMVTQRLDAAAVTGTEGTAETRPEQSLRKVAIILRNLEKDLRDSILETIQKKDKEAGQTVINLMVVWDDIPQVADRSLQEALRGTDEGKLALALHEADDAIAQKIRANISERAAAMVDEEASLMSAPKSEDIKQARETIVSALREMNGKGELAFVEE